ncbi:hypothetical protein Tco_0072613 [Tanacetum coccineum]
MTDEMILSNLLLKIQSIEDNMMIEKADANLIEPNANLVGESSSKSKSNHKNKGKMVVVLDKNILRMERKITPNKRTTTLRKFIIVVSVGNLGIKLSIVATRKSMEAEILEETPTKQTMLHKAHMQFKKDVCILQKVNESDPMFMGNGTASKIEGKGKV